VSQPGGVNITAEQMYSLLLDIDRKVSGLVRDTANQEVKLADHEERLRAIESEEDQGRRVSEMEADVKAIRSELEEIKRRVWAIPSAGIIISLTAVVLTIVAFVRTL